MISTGSQVCFWLLRTLCHVCGESRRKDGAVIRITALKGNRIYFLLKKGAAGIRHGRIKVFIWCAAIILWTDFAREKSKAKEAHCVCKGRAREIHWFLFGQKRFQLMATRTKADFCNSYKKNQKQKQTKARFSTLIENQMASLRSIKTQFGLLVSFQSSETMTHYLDHYFFQRGPLRFLIKTMKQQLKTCSYAHASLMKWKAR